MPSSQNATPPTAPCDAATIRLAPTLAITRSRVSVSSRSLSCAGNGSRSLSRRLIAAPSRSRKKSANSIARRVPSAAKTPATNDPACGARYASNRCAPRVIRSVGSSGSATGLRCRTSSQSRCSWRGAPCEACFSESIACGASRATVETRKRVGVTIRRPTVSVVMSAAPFAPVLRESASCMRRNSIANITAHVSATKNGLRTR